MKIGFFGTGLMGEPMAKRLLDAYGSLGVFNRTKEKTKKLSEAGAIVFDNAESLVDYSDVIICMLSEIDAIVNVFLGIPKDSYKGKTFINMSTIAPAESLNLAEFFTDAGCEFIEAPVLGSIPQVVAGELIIMVSSPEKSFEQYSEIFNHLGKKVVFMGDYSKASAIKLALNQLIATLTTAFSMSLGFVRESNVDVDIFMDILRNSALYAPTFDKKLDRMLNWDFSNPNFPLKHLLKDVHLMIDSFMKKDINVDTLFGVESVIRAGLEEGHSDEDYSSLYAAVHKKKEN